MSIGSLIRTAYNYIYEKQEKALREAFENFKRIQPKEMVTELSHPIGRPLPAPSNKRPRAAPSRRPQRQARLHCTKPQPNFYAHIGTLQRAGALRVV